MNGIDDLRSTLSQHADDIVDHDLGGRLGSVRDRVRVVRRQRRAAVGGGLALTLAAVGGVALLPEWGKSPSATPAAATVAGVPVPETMKALGYTFAFDEGVDGKRSASLDLEASDRPRLVSWGTSGADDLVELGDGSSTTEYDVPDFSDFVWVPAGGKISFSVSGGNQVGLAVYELTDAAPAGVSGSGVTYREVVADRRLLDAEIGEPGQTEVSVSATEAGAGHSYTHFCANGPAEATLHVDDGSEVIASPVTCDNGVPFDPANQTTYSLNPGGSSASYRIWLTDGENGPRIDDDDLVLGLGLYDAGRATRVAGLDVPEVIEYDGHLWRSFSIQPTDVVGDSSLAVLSDADPTRPMLAAGYYAAGAAVVEMRYDGQRVEAVRGGSILFGPVTAPAAEVRLQVRGDVPDDAQLLIVEFEQVD